MRTELLHSLFHDVREHGSARIRKSRLLWLLGRVHETPSIWDMILVEWRAFGETRPLHALRWGDEFTLTAAVVEDVAANWTTSRRIASPAAPLQLSLVS